MTTPPSGAVIGFITFIASTISNVSPALTVSPTSTNGFAPGSADRKAVPTIGDLTRVAGDFLRLRRRFAVQRRARRGAAAAAGAAPAQRR